MSTGQIVAGASVAIGAMQSAVGRISPMLVEIIIEARTTASPRTLGTTRLALGNQRGVIS